MLNYNPETVSTDYDECERLYFDEISFEVGNKTCMQESFIPLLSNSCYYGCQRFVMQTRQMALSLALY